jgi:hypothetical protein
MRVIFNRVRERYGFEIDRERYSTQPPVVAQPPRQGKLSF